MSEFVLDASALLAFLRKEKGGARVEKVLHRSVISAVNLSEVVAKAISEGGTLETITNLLASLSMRVVPFEAEDAFLTASLRSPTARHGLSLGDRSCLALGLKTGLVVMTAERNWPNDLGVRIETIR